MRTQTLIFVDAFRWHLNSIEWTMNKEAEEAQDQANGQPPWKKPPQPPTPPRPPVVEVDAEDEAEKAEAERQMAAKHSSVTSVEFMVQRPRRRAGGPRDHGAQQIRGKKKHRRAPNFDDASARRMPLRATG